MYIGLGCGCTGCGAEAVMVSTSHVLPARVVQSVVRFTISGFAAQSVSMSCEYKGVSVHPYEYKGVIVHLYEYKGVIVHLYEYKVYGKHLVELTESVRKAHREEAAVVLVQGLGLRD